MIKGKKKKKKEERETGVWCWTLQLSYNYELKVLIELAWKENYHISLSKKDSLMFNIYSTVWRHPEH